MSQLHGKFATSWLYKNATQTYHWLMDAENSPAPFNDLPRDRALVLYVPPGRPDTITQDVCDKICLLLACGYSLKDICAMDDMPDRVTVWRWRYKFHSFAEQFDKANKARTEVMAEELLEIADDARNDYMEKFDNKGNFLGYFVNGEAIQRSKLRVDLRKWLMGKMNSKYADKPVMGESKETPLHMQMSVIGQIFDELNGTSSDLPCNDILPLQKSN